MPNDVYSPYKAAYHIERILALRNNELIYPTQIQVDLTNQCNHHCVYCFSKFTINNGFGSLSIDTKDILKLLDDAVELGIKSFHFTGGGEPFMRSNIYEILKRTVDNNLEYGMVTNASLIDFNKSDLLKKMSWIRISLDASNPSMYRRLRGVNEFDKVIQTVKDFYIICPDTELGLSFVINPINYSQIVKFAELGLDLGVNNIRYSIAWFPQGQRKYVYIMNNINKLLNKAKKLENKDYKVFDLTKGRLENLSLNNADYSSCGYQHFTTVIGADSVVYPCCTLKYNSLASFGSLKEQSFEDIWMGQRRRRWIESSYLGEVCSKNICWMQDKNKFIGYLTKKNPRHVNFI